MSNTNAPAAAHTRRTYRVRASELAGVVQRCMDDDRGQTCIAIRDYLDARASRAQGVEVRHGCARSLSLSLLRLWWAAGVREVGLNESGEQLQCSGGWEEHRPRLLEYLKSQPAGKAFVLHADQQAPRDAGARHTTGEDGRQWWYRDGLLHREDGPAFIDTSGYAAWYLRGRRHRADGPAIIEPSGYEGWYLDGLLHRVGGPAITRPDGSTGWYLHGQRHRADGPAIIEPSGYEAWYQDGKLHREDGPASVRPNGSQEWYLRGQRHRVGGPAAVRPDGQQEWYQDGKLHREGGPAVVRPDGQQEWYRDGKLHREGGPAVVRPDGQQEWYLRGQRHRVGGPAITEPGGYEEWYWEGERHREGGPAIVWAGGEQEWYLHGYRFETQAEHQHAQALAEHGGYILFRVPIPGQPVLYVAGCRRFNLAEARAHWREGKSNRPPFIQALDKEI